MFIIVRKKFILQVLFGSPGTHEDHTTIKTPEDLKNLLYLTG